MARLNNQSLKDGFCGNIRNSFGPFLSIGDENYVFDARPREKPLWLGYNASPLFGVVQHLESWTGRRTESFARIEYAYQHLTGRLKNAYCRPIRLESADSLKPAGLLYNYYCLSILDQFTDEHQAIAKEIEERFGQLTSEFPDLIKEPDVDAVNFEFGFLPGDANIAAQFENAQAHAGILSQDCKSTGMLRFQLNMAYRQQEMNLFWQQMNWVFRFVSGEHHDHSAPFPTVELSLPQNVESLYDFHESLIHAKVTGKLPKKNRVESFLSEQTNYHSSSKLQFTLLDRDNYPRFREKILSLQQDVYEPARRSPPDEFDMLFNSEKPLGILMLDGDAIGAMAFAGRLGLFRQERGVTEDPFVDDPDTFYNMDLTIAPEFRGGLGRVMKQAMLLLAKENGVTAIHGRNRDRMARGMWAINMSLGSFELQYLVDDYPDDGLFRDCIYYRCPLEWDDEGDERIQTERFALGPDRVSASIAEMVNGIEFGSTTEEGNSPP